MFAKRSNALKAKHVFAAHVSKTIVTVRDARTDRYAVMELAKPIHVSKSLVKRTNSAAMAIVSMHVSKAALKEPYAKMDNAFPIPVVVLVRKGLSASMATV